MFKVNARIADYKDFSTDASWHAEFFSKKYHVLDVDDKQTRAELDSSLNTCRMMANEKYLITRVYEGCSEIRQQNIENIGFSVLRSDRARVKAQPYGYPINFTGGGLSNARGATQPGCKESEAIAIVVEPISRYCNALEVKNVSLVKKSLEETKRQLEKALDEKDKLEKRLKRAKLESDVAYESEKIITDMIRGMFGRDEAISSLRDRNEALLGKIRDLVKREAHARSKAEVCFSRLDRANSEHSKTEEGFSELKSEYKWLKDKFEDLTERSVLDKIRVERCNNHDLAVRSIKEKIRNIRGKLYEGSK